MGEKERAVKGCKGLWGEGLKGRWKKALKGKERRRSERALKGVRRGFRVVSRGKSVV